MIEALQSNILVGALLFIYRDKRHSGTIFTCIACVDCLSTVFILMVSISYCYFVCYGYHYLTISVLKLAYLGVNINYCVYSIYYYTI